MNEQPRVVNHADPRSVPRFPHQIAATEAMIEKPALVIGFRPGRGKSRAVVDAACDLYDSGVIDTLLVVAPANLRSIWADPDPVLGEFSKWAWQPHTITEYHAKTQIKTWRPEGLAVVVTNPEFLRRVVGRGRTARYPRLDPLIDWLKGRRTLLVLDESWLYKNPRSKQTAAIAKLRRACQRVVLLNGTLGRPDEQYAQFTICNQDIFDRMNWWQWRGRYCVMGGFQQKQIIGYANVDEYTRRTAPFVLLDDGGDDFGRIAPPVRTQIEVPLSKETWKLYKDLRKDFVVWLSDTEAATAYQAGVRTLRLCQIVNGFLGGIESEETLFGGAPKGSVREVGREKLNALVEVLTHEMPDKALIFTRFRADVERTVAHLTEQFPHHRVVPIYGAQPPEEREEAKRLLAPDGDPRPALVVANEQSGGAGLNLAAAALCIFLGHGWSVKDRIQAEGRVDRTGQTRQVRYIDMLATGPEGQKTVDHLVVSALRQKTDLSLTMLQAWATLEDA